MNDLAVRGMKYGRGAGPGPLVGVAVFALDGTLLHVNESFIQVLNIPASCMNPGQSFHEFLHKLQLHTDYAGGDGAAVLAALTGLDRSRQSAIVHTRTDGRAIDVQSDPFPDGGWSLTVSENFPPVLSGDAAQRRAGLLDSILQQVPHGIAVYGPDRRLTMVNEAYYRIMAGAPISIGDTVAEVIRRRAAAGEFGDGDPDAIVAQQMAHDITQPQMRRRQRPDGRTIDVRTAPLPDGGHISVVTDVTSLTEAQAEAAMRAELMASIVSHIPHGVSVFGPDRKLRLVNAAYDQIMDGAPVTIGETVEQIIEKRARAGEFGSGSDQQTSVRSNAPGKSNPNMRRRTRANGSTIDIRTAPLPDGGHISVVTDVTPLVEAERELIQRAGTMDAMLANIRHGIVLWGADRTILAANAAVVDMLAAPPGLFVPGTTLDRIVQSALDRGNLGEGEIGRTRAQWLLEQDRGKSHHDQRLTRTGRVIEVRSDPTPQGGFVTTYTDVTQSREAEDALRLAKSAAEAANVAKSRFLATISTELRTPLSTILGEVGGIARDATGVRARLMGEQAPGGLNITRIQDSCATASDAARRLLGLIDTILDVARLEAGRYDLADSVVDVPQLVRACLRQSDSGAAAAEVALVADLPDDLPSIRCDERRMRQVLNHLVSNAVKFTGAMGSVSISARLEWASGDMLINVQDTGIGIAASDLESVFEPFTQSGAGPAGGETGAPGAGLGLYISRMLLRAHGGDVLLRSVPAQGTTAVVRIPAARVLQEPGRDPTW